MAEITHTLLIIEAGLALDSARQTALATIAAHLHVIDAVEWISDLADPRPDVIIILASAASRFPEQFALERQGQRDLPPVILLTRRPQTDAVLRALRLRFYDYQSLAGTPDDLVASVRTAIDQGTNSVADSSQLADHELIVSLVSHELRNPLMTISGYLELMRKHQGRLTEEKTRAYLDRSLEAMQEATYLADMLSQIMQLEAGQGLGTHERIPLAALIDTCLASLAGRTDRHTFVCQVPRDLTVMADPLALRQIIRNLLSNAIKYAPDGGTITIVAISGTGRMATIGVRDEGIGIDPEQMPKLFTRFGRVHNLQQWPSIRGTGLGLYLCRHLVEAMGGHIWAESTPGGGSLFSFTLPQAGRMAQPIAAKRHARSAS